MTQSEFDRQKKNIRAAVERIMSEPRDARIKPYKRGAIPYSKQFRELERRRR